ncbi:MAG: hypothetical protein ABL973_18740 [Micropepsaceae bacterium]
MLDVRSAADGYDLFVTGLRKWHTTVTCLSEVPCTQFVVIEHPVDAQPHYGSLV